MTQEKEQKETQYWRMAMTIFPAVFLSKLGGGEIAELYGGNSLLYAGVFGGIGALVGEGVHYLTRDKSKGVKIAATLGLVACLTVSTMFLLKKETDEQIVQKAWVAQEIGEIGFETPTELEKVEMEITPDLEDVYKELNIYAEENDDNVIMFVESEMTSDSLNIVDGFSGGLENMVNSLDVDFEDVDVNVITNTEEEFKARFSFDLNGNIAVGYGVMVKNGQSIDAIWLMPKTTGFSDAFIEKFDKSLM